MRLLHHSGFCHEENVRAVSEHHYCPARHHEIIQRRESIFIHSRYQKEGIKQMAPRVHRIVDVINAFFIGL